VRVHIIGINYWPEKTGIAVFATGRAEFLAAQGHQVAMCTALPYYPEWRVADEYRGRSFAIEMRAGVEICRCPIYVPSRVTPIRRVLFEASFLASASVRSLFCRRPDVLFVESPPLGLAIVAALLSGLWHVPYVFQVEDLQPDAALDLGMLHKGRGTRLLYALERFAYRKAATVSTLTPGMQARIISKGISAEKVTLFPCWAEPGLFGLRTDARSARVRHALGLNGAFVVLHPGNMGIKQGLGVLLDAAERTRSTPEIVYVLLGDGVARPALESRVRSAGLTNVRIIPLLPEVEFLDLLAEADLCVVAQQRTVADIVFPSKVLTLLAAGKPVVASVAASSEVAMVVGGSGAGEVVAPEDPGALVAAIERLRAAGTLREGMGAAGREYARRHWDRGAILGHFAATLEAVAGGRRVRPDLAPEPGSKRVSGVPH
jgi:colanic acid biosynthesis glycosyl transferase WcaI